MRLVKYTNANGDVERGNFHLPFCHSANELGPHSILVTSCDLSHILGIIPTSPDFPNLNSKASPFYKNKRHPGQSHSIYTLRLTDTSSLTLSSCVSMLPFGRSDVKLVSRKLILTWLAADVEAAPLCGFVASSSTFSEAIACSCVAFSSTLPKTSSYCCYLCAQRDQTRTILIVV